MIPKRIHYCWFGRGEMPKLMQKCLKSWKKFCPDWEIVCWDENSFDVNSTLWTKQAYEAKKYAFVADYVRIKALYEQGGVYMDTDQELIKSLEPFLKHQAFMGFLDKTNISAGVMGFEREHEIMKTMFDYYRERPFLVGDSVDIRPNTNWMTDILVEKGLLLEDRYQEISGIAVYPQTYFCPTSCVSIEDCSGPDTVSLHHWAMTWRTEKAKKDFARVKWHQTKRYKALIWLRYLPNRVVRKIFGDAAIDKLKTKLGK